MSNLRFILRYEIFKIYVRKQDDTQNLRLKFKISK